MKSRENGERVISGHKPREAGNLLDWKAKNQSGTIYLLVARQREEIARVWQNHFLKSQ
jgi:hypothetical protein